MPLNGQGRALWYPCRARGVTTRIFVKEKIPRADQKVMEERKKFYRLLKAADLVCTVASKNGGWVTMELPRYNRYWAPAQHHT